MDITTDNPFFAFAMLAHVVVACISSVHILLTKRDVRAAIGWTGLVWLSPLVGVVLYITFGISRVARRAVRSSKRGHTPVVPSRLPQRDIGPVSSEPLEGLRCIGDAISRHSVMAGNRIGILQNGMQAYPAMLADINSAKSFVCLTTYILRSDRVGEEFADALIAAFERGVEVRVIVDRIGSGLLRSNVVRRLQVAGVPVVRFLSDWRPWRMAQLNLRNHKKLLLIDGKRAYVGGLNLGRENTQGPGSTLQVADIQFQVEGPVVAQVMDTFAADWEFATGDVLEGDIWKPTTKVVGVSSCRVLVSGPDEELDSIEILLCAALGAAQRHVRIVTPYFLPDEVLSEALRLATLRGVHIDVVLPERSDHKIMDWALHGHLPFLDFEGLCFHFTAEPFDHAKLVSIDGEWCAFGSPNWDARSLRLNFEILVECYCRELVIEVDRVMSDRMALARPLRTDELPSQGAAVRLRNAMARLLLPYL